MDDELTGLLGTIAAIARAGYVPCSADGGCCPGRAQADDAVWIAPGLLLASYPPTDCGHCGPSSYLLHLDAADLDAADEQDRAIHGGDDAP